MTALIATVRSRALCSPLSPPRLLANAVMITNRNGTILWVNPAFTAVTGYTLDEAVGKTPRLLKSGKHDEALYKGFWKTILSGETWRGEFINRRKDGGLYYDENTVAVS